MALPLSLKKGKIIEAIIKSAYCKVCEYLEKEKDKDIEQHREEHQAVCEINYADSAEKMEVKRMIEM